MAWSQGRRPDTPAEEYPSNRAVCVAGLAAVTERTATWLALAADYQMQAAEGNAGVIATQLCLERRYDSLECLGGSPDGSPGGSTSGACEDDPAWSSTLTYMCPTYTDGVRSSNHAYCAEDADASGRLAVDACPVACGVCSPQDASSPASILTDLHDQACALSETIGKQGHSIDSLLATAEALFDELSESAKVISADLS